MLDIGWTELVVIAIVLIVVVGPKDLPPMLRAFGRMTSKMRGMAADFRRQFDEALREADLEDVRKTISDAQSLNPTTALRDAMNPLRQLGNEIKSDLQKAATPDIPAQAGAAEPAVEPAAATAAPVEAPARPADQVAAAAISSASRQMDRVTAEEPKLAETKPKRAAKPRTGTASKAPAAAAAAPKKAAGAATVKKPAASKTVAGEGQPETGTKKTRAPSRKKGNA
ncbi:Sec-independent protein translocase protein TatB [Sinorhizobium numidicum]|uniref:Sec-independent protein translocase protein TatB n=1 Tax=Sinorhizobium numidicum TaxID=680248 RepID=A0ABY8CXQ9_9HYPH|nr:Sec-independent protein translocase protein TatB [Sinorhizobium numidicum]WEX78850.1 Sec-independent protein translocase protein TatB [Sinorhizobium numidicum]WEX82247.1 Sec-independent protein translocase protein TatB [Sinorhizobium numidicum]